MSIDSNINMPSSMTIGRFAPSPSGRMHLGNVFTALISWLSVKKSDGKWILRIEDLDPQRSKVEHAKMIEDDLQWLGLAWDEGGLDNIGSHGPYVQSQRSDLYEQTYERIVSLGLTYRCHCTRADIMATQAPHESDGRIVYQGTCRPCPAPPFDNDINGAGGAVRLFVPNEEFSFTDRVYGRQAVNLTEHCGDFVLRRADKAWAYQLAVVVDDAMMGVTEVVRGNDLLLSTAQQLYLYRLIGKQAPDFAHLPLICNSAKQRLSKRDQSMSMEHLRATLSPEEITGKIAHMAHIIPEYEPCKPCDLIELFDWTLIRPNKSIII